VHPGSGPEGKHQDDNESWTSSSQDRASEARDEKPMNNVKRPPKRKAEPRLAVHIHIHMTAPYFSLVGLVIGKSGCNLRRIAQFTGAYLRVRGRGSGYLESKGQREAPAPLMIAVTGNASDPLSFKKAVWLTLQHLSTVEARFLNYCRKQGFRTMGGPHFHIGFLNEGAVAVLSGVN